MWDLWPALMLILAGAAAGCINALVGSGTLITFPTLLALGVPPVSANMTSSLGIFAGNITSLAGYSSAVAACRPLLRWLAPAALIGGLSGSVLLLWLPSTVFGAVVPWLIGLALVLVAIGPWLTKTFVKDPQNRPVFVPLPVLAVLVGLAGVYGGYFGAAQGVLLMGILGVLSSESLQTLNGLKITLVTLVNLMSLAVFLGIAWDRIDWAGVLWVAIGSAIGGWLGGRYGSQLPPWALRIVILVVGTTALIVMILRG